MREEQRRSPPGPLVSADWCPPEGYRRLGEAWNVDRGESGIDRVPKAGAVDEYQGGYASRGFDDLDWLPAARIEQGS